MCEHLLAELSAGFFGGGALQGYLRGLLALQRAGSECAANARIPNDVVCLCVNARM